jgi:hypothetical protein
MSAIETAASDRTETATAAELAADAWVVAWTPAWAPRPDAGAIRVGPYPDVSGCSGTDRFLFSDGPHKWPARSSRMGKTLRLFTLFARIVGRDGIDADTAHNEFRMVRAYRERVGSRQGKRSRTAFGPSRESPRVK